MSSAFRTNRKATDAQIIKLNSLGLSLATIGKMLNCHPTTITARLEQLGVEPADTRRAFMERIVLSLPQNQQDWLAVQLGPQLSINQFVHNLIVSNFLAQNS